MDKVFSVDDMLDEVKKIGFSADYMFNLARSELSIKAWIDDPTCIIISKPFRFRYINSCNYDPNLEESYAFERRYVLCDLITRCIEMKKEKEKEKEMKDTKQTFTRDDLKAGYIIELRDGTCRSIQMVGRETLIAVAGRGDKDWTYVSRGWDTHMDHRDHGGTLFPYPVHDKSKDIVAVYGYIQGIGNYPDCAMISPDHRPLLWSRVDPKKMTVEEIENALGYKVEIVSD